MKTGRGGTGGFWIVKFPSSYYASLNLIHLNMNPMSNADRRHVFFELKRSEQKNTHGVNIIYVVQGADKWTFFCLFCLRLRERRLCCSVRKLSTQLNELHPSHCAGGRSWSPIKWRCDGGAASREKKLSDEQKPSSIRVKRKWVWMWCSPVLELRSASPLGTTCQIRSQKFPSDVCWGKRGLRWECELSPASLTAGSVCYGDEEEGRK